MKVAFQPGITTLLEKHRSWIAGRKIGLLSHPAATNSSGASAVELLLATGGIRLVCLFGPEHGFFGSAPAGEAVRGRIHPCWHIPVHSLYGKNRRPTPAMLRDVDTLIFDLQDLGARPYTYVGTLRYLLEEAARHGKEVIVADRPIPLPCVVDGPLLSPSFESFVASLPVPVSYGMTPGETALWLQHAMIPEVTLKIAPMQGYRRDPTRNRDWPPWTPPSPGIRSWESAACYPATVFCEALPAVDYGRGSGLPFQLIGSPWMKSRAVCEHLLDLRLPGVEFYPHAYQPPSCTSSCLFDGVRIVVTNPKLFRPVLTGISILAALQRLYGQRRIWKVPGTRPDFFDKLMGTDSVRNSLLAGEAPRSIEARWRRDSAAFCRSRKAVLLYDPN